MTNPTKKKRQRWKAGDYFAVPLVDGSFSLGQVLLVDGLPISGFFMIRSRKPGELLERQPKSTDLLSIAATTRFALADGHWLIVGHGDPVVSESRYAPLRRLPRGTFSDYGILEDLMNAAFALRPWNQYAEPDYFDRHLVGRNKKPKRLLFWRDFPGEHHDQLEEQVLRTRQARAPRVLVCPTCRGDLRYFYRRETGPVFTQPTPKPLYATGRLWVWCSACWHQQTSWVAVPRSWRERAWVPDGILGHKPDGLDDLWADISRPNFVPDWYRPRKQPR